MRRSRHKLQPSTFPFLAVLLAAMGSLILLLLVMDRRAKIVARNKAKEALAARQSQSTEDEEQRREWERARADLHARLEAEGKELAGLKDRIQEREAQTVQQVRDAQNQTAALEQALVQEKANLEKQQRALQERQAAWNQEKARDNAMSQTLLTERKRLAGQLTDLEQTLRALRLLKGREEHTYSLVAYRGRHGENRKPIYVECRREGVAFHPGGKILSGPAWADEAFRAEVKAQGAALEKTKPPAPGQRQAASLPATGAYVLFLVRPEGIDTYYEAASALKGYEIDFGYEFIDAAWLLDFGGEGEISDPRLGIRSQGVGEHGPGGKQGSEAGKAPLGSGGDGSPGYVTGFGTGSVAGSKIRKGGWPQPTFSPDPPSLPPEVRPSSSGSELPAWRAVQPGAQPSGQKGPPEFTGQPPPPLGPENNGPGPSQQSPGSMAQGNAREPPDPLSRPPLPGQQTPAKPAAPSLGKVLGNRDFVVTIECLEEFAAVYPGGKTFSLKGGESRQQAEALTQHVQQMISRRQASVRPGEPPSRPMLRLQVQPEGLRSYYRVYPPLERLRLPMSRENVEE